MSDARKPSLGTFKSDPPLRNEPYVAPVNGICQPVTKPTPERPGRYTNQLKYLRWKVLGPIWRHEFGWRFHKPVDAVKFNIPNYHRVIRKPMDLGTIKKRLKYKYYWSAKECVADFKTFFTNCYVFYKAGHHIVQEAQTLEEIFDTKLTGMPEEEEEIESQPRGKGGKPPGLPEVSATSSQSNSPDGESNQSIDVSEEDRESKIVVLQYLMKDLEKQMEKLIGNVNLGTTRKKRKGKKKLCITGLKAVQSQMKMLSEIINSMGTKTAKEKKIENTKIVTPASDVVILDTTSSSCPSVAVVTQKLPNRPKKSKLGEEAIASSSLGAPLSKKQKTDSGANTKEK